MKSIKDAPELKAALDAAWDDILFKDKVSKEKSQISYEDIAEHFFLKGFDVAMATNGMKHGRRIAEIMQTDDKLIAVSNDRQAFVWNENDMKWEPMPRLPQD